MPRPATMGAASAKAFRPPGGGQSHALDAWLMYCKGGRGRRSWLSQNGMCRCTDQAPPEGNEARRDESS